MKKSELLLNKGERRIIIILLICALSSQFISFNLKPNSNVNNVYSNLDEALIAIELNKSEDNTYKKNDNDELSYRYQSKLRNNSNPTKKYPSNKLKYKKERSFQNTTSPKLFNFDPNIIDSTSFIKLGIKHWVVSNILKYRKKGGLFRTSNDLDKIYGLNEYTLSKIKPYCQIDSLKHKNKTKTYLKTQLSNAKKHKININNADTLTLQKLYGIGTKLAERIVKYRINIGGFHSIQQLTEVYGIKPEVISNNIEVLECNGPLIKIDINTIQKDSLVKHFYFDYRASNAIINYRHQHGAYTNKSQLNNLKTLSKETINKILPYISLNGKT